MIGNILDNTTELYMIKYTFGEIFSSGGATLCKNPSDQTVTSYTLNSYLRLVSVYPADLGLTTYYLPTFSEEFFWERGSILKK